MTVRVYVPTDLAALARYTEEGGIGPSPVHAHAVTAWMRTAWPEAEQDEWEYAALMAAAADSAGALGQAPAEEAVPRRVVVVAEVEQVTEDRESTAVSVDSAIALRQLVAVHADTTDIPLSSTGDLDDLDDLDDLGWFGVQEIPRLLATWDGPG